MAVEIHSPLTVDDLFRAADLVAAVLDHVDGDTIDRMRKGEIEYAELGRQLSVIALRVAPEAGKRFLAGLCDYDEAEFGVLPMESILDVVEQLVAREDVAGFFKRARALVPQSGSDSGSENPAKAPQGASEPAS